MAVLVVAAGLAFTFGLVRAVASEIPALDPAAQRSDVDTVIYAENGRSVLAVLRGDESRVLVATEEIAPIMRQAIVSVEDQRFYEHDGVDVRGIARALWQDVREQGIVEGGSTITQQFVKNAYIRNEKTLARKVREAALAWQLEQSWTKDRILTAYLNTIYFGHGAYGIQQAARAYYKKGAKDLNLAESALLAGIPADPSLYDPAVNPRNATLRRRHVLGMMLAQGKITQRQFARADKAELPEPEDIRLPGTRGDAPYFTNYVTDQLVAEYGGGKVFGGGLRVTTTIDLELQEKARKAIEKVLRNPDGPAAALVAIDPRSGEVKAMVGGRNFRESQFNLAAQAKRQPGSAFKPIVLAAAMSEGISPVTELESKPVSIDAGDRIWKVTNYDKTYLGRVSLSRAMVSSDNSVYAQLTDVVGPKAIVQTAHRLGIRSRLSPYFSIGLGSVAVSPLEMARAYATLANEGRRVDGSSFGNRPRVVETVEFYRSSRFDDERADPEAGDGGESRRAPHRHPRGRRPVGHRHPRGDRRPRGRGQDRHDRQLRRRLVRRLYARARRGRLGRVPRRAAADAHRVQRRGGRGWNASGADLEGVRREGSRGRRSRLRLPSLPRRHLAVGRPPRGRVAARQRLLPRRAARRVLLGPRPRVGGRLQAERGERAAGRRDDEGRCRGRASRRSHSRRTSSTRPAKPGKLPGLVVDQDPRRGGLSANDERDDLRDSTARFGILPNFVGSSLADVQRRRSGSSCDSSREPAPGREGTVLRQVPEPGVATAPRMRVRLVVGDGSRS